MSDVKQGVFVEGRGLVPAKEAQRLSLGDRVVVARRIARVKGLRFSDHPGFILANVRFEDDGSESDLTFTFGQIVGLLEDGDQ